MTSAPTYCEQTRLRIRLSVYALAYEVHSDPLVSDSEFDSMARRVDLSIPTARPDLDQWFAENFNPSTGMWVLSHPEMGRLDEIYQSLKVSMIETIYRRLIRK
jgi:hypothetical protein